MFPMEVRSRTVAVIAAFGSNEGELFYVLNLENWAQVRPKFLKPTTLIQELKQNKTKKKEGG